MPLPEQEPPGAMPGCAARRVGSDMKRQCRSLRRTPARFLPGFSRIPHIDCRSNWFALSRSINRFAAVPDQREANHARFQIRLGAITPNLSDDCLIRLHLQHRVSALSSPKRTPYPLPAGKRQAAGLTRRPPCVAKLVNHPWKTARPDASTRYRCEGVHAPFQ